jgi:hypothetical protein
MLAIVLSRDQVSTVFSVTFAPLFHQLILCSSPIGTSSIFEFCRSMYDDSIYLAIILVPPSGQTDATPPVSRFNFKLSLLLHIFSYDSLVLVPETRERRGKQALCPVPTRTIYQSR